MHRRKWALAALALASLAAIPAVKHVKLGEKRGTTIRVSSGQDVELGTFSFEGRPADFGLHPEAEILAVNTATGVFLATPKGVLARTPISREKGVGAGFRGVLWTNDRRGANWTPQGMRFVVSTDQGYLQEYLYEDLELFPKEKIWLVPEDKPRQVWPGGMCLSPDSKHLYVAVAELGSVAEIDLQTHKKLREIPVGKIPFECRLSGDGQTLVVSNWGGHEPTANQEVNESNGMKLAIDHKGFVNHGSVTLIDLPTGSRKDIEVGMHPSNICIDGNDVYVSVSASGKIVRIDLKGQRIADTFALTDVKGNPIPGATPTALVVDKANIYVCNSTANSVHVMNRSTGRTLGYYPTGYYPISLEFSHDRSKLYALNSKGNGSIANTERGNAGNPHDFQGSVTVVPLNQDPGAATHQVERNNHWNEDPLAEAKNLKVYNGAVKHVLYIIKENQTYDSIYGDMPEGNGDSSLCVLGEKTMPNHRKIARDFALFDNAYVSGTNSADGHAWSTQAVANDYLEREYVGYRTYPDDGDDPMSISSTGCLWDQVLKAGKTLRVYGEYCDDRLATFEPRQPKNWFEAWEDYKSGKNTFKYHIDTRIPALKPYVCRDMHYWPIIESDQHRADVFLKEYEAFSKQDNVPGLMILTLTNDHGSGLDPDFPTYPAMAADNDLAFGRVVDAVTHSPQWKDTCIFMIEDDGQALPDHVDGHRTAFSIVCPYLRRHTVDSSFITTVSLLRSIEVMLGLDPMHAIDGATPPITSCFTNTLDLTPYDHTPNKRPLDERNPPLKALTSQGQQMAKLSGSLDWSHLDAPDPTKLSRIHWFSATNGRPYPLR